MSSTNTVTGIRTADLPNLGAVTDSSIFVADRAGTGTFPATAVRDYMRGGNLTSVKGWPYNAKGDGVTDDTAAINAALAAVCNVYIPEGTYKITDSLNVNRDGAYVVGAGRNATKIVSSSTTAPAIAMGSFLTGVTIEHMTIDRSAVPVAGANGINDLVSSEFTRLSDLVVQNHWVGVALGPTGYSYVENVISWMNYSDGFYMTNTAASGGLQWSFTNCLAEQNAGRGFVIAAQATGPTAIALGEFTSCATYANDGAGFAASGVAGCPIYGVRITGGFFGADGNHEVFLDTRGGEHQINGLFTELCGTVATGRTFATPISHVGAGFFITANNLDVHLNGCYAEGHSESGFVSAAPEVQIISCKSMNNGMALISGDRAGVSITAGRALIQSLRAGNLAGNTSQLYGVQISDASTGPLIWGADLTGNVTSPLNIIAGTTGLTSGGIIPSGNLLMPNGGISLGNASGGPTAGGINVASHVAQNGVNFNNP